ncbi:MAG: hypothetical protein JXJ04_22855 [Spirochaetales bacterium]|nr:hypothetical protein [Spirochaetales bacterium]
MFDENGFLPRLYSWCTRFESIWTSFGDQGLVFRKSFYYEIGGFPETLIFEDVIILRKARKHGRILKLPGYVITSPRMFKKNGYIKQQLKNGYLLLRYLTGTSTSTIYQNYYNK